MPIKAEKIKKPISALLALVLVLTCLCAIAESMETENAAPDYSQKETEDLTCEKMDVPFPGAAVADLHECCLGGGRNDLFR